MQDIHAVGPSDPQTQMMEVPHSSKTSATQLTATWCKNPRRELTLKSNLVQKINKKMSEQAMLKFMDMKWYQ
jgi:hypothetical protein